MRSRKDYNSRKRLTSDQVQLNLFSCKDYSLMEKVLNRENMLKALKKVKSNKGAAGIDGMQIEDLHNYLVVEWPRIKEELSAGTYKPKPVRRVVIPKPDGGERYLGIPTVLDRLIQQAVLQILTPIYEPTFSEHSYGFRPGRNAHKAIRQAQQYIKSGSEIVVDIDLEKFFDKVNHDKLMSILSREIADKRVLRLIRKFLTAGIMERGCCIKSEIGTPQGGPLSPLLANVMLDGLDKELEKRGHKFVRYADDCNIYVKSRRAGYRVIESIKRFVEMRLKLNVNEAKSAVDIPNERKFLGISFCRDAEARIKLAPKSIKRFKETIRELSRYRIPIKMSERIARINRFLTGWMSYYRIIEAPSDLKDLDRYVRRRLRMCRLKQWRLPKTRKRELLDLGARPRDAALLSSSGKGAARLSKAPAIRIALRNKYWKNLGLLNVTEIYAELC